VNERKKAAQRISRYLPEVRFIASVVNRIMTEQDIEVRSYLLEYIARQPRGSLQEYFLNSDFGTKASISRNRELLARLAKEPNENIHLFVLDSLAHFDATEIFPFILLFCRSNNSAVRSKAFDIISKVKTNDSRVICIFSEALLDSFPEIRLVALRYLRKIEDLDTRVIPSFFASALDSNEEISTAAFSILEKSDVLANADFVHFLNITKKVKRENRALGIADKLFLRKFVKKHPEMKKVAITLSIKEIRDDE
jgi:hypothetical protein